MIEIRKFKNGLWKGDNVNEIYELGSKIFGAYMPLDKKDFKREVWDFDRNLSFVVTDDKKIVGFYLLKKLSLSKNEQYLDDFDYRSIANLKGLQGLALGLLPEYRAQGLGKKLIELPKTLGYNYIWGLHDSRLGNIEQWCKRRKLIIEDHSINIPHFTTIEIF